MKKTLLTTGLMVCIIVTASMSYGWEYYAVNFTTIITNGWSSPLKGRGYNVPLVPYNESVLYTSHDFDFLSKIYEKNWSNQHTGIDLLISNNDDYNKKSVNFPIATVNVYAIADGVVSRIEDDNNNPREDLSVICIRHLTKSGQIFTAVYGHCKGVNGLKKYDIVSSGQHIGYMMLFNKPQHLHFEINLVKNFRAGRGHGWGMLNKGEDVIANGRRNPETFLSDNYPYPSGAYFSDGVKVSDYLFSDVLFDDAENKYPDYFPPRKQNLVYHEYVYRYYSIPSANDLIYLLTWKGNFWLNDGWGWNNLGSMKKIQEQFFPNCGRDPLNFPKDEGTICKDIWWW